MAQAFTFRAVGAGTPSFYTACEARASSIRSRFADEDKNTFEAKSVALITPDRSRPFGARTL